MSRVSRSRVGLSRAITRSIAPPGWLTPALVIDSVIKAANHERSSDINVPTLEPLLGMKGYFPLVALSKSTLNPLRLKNESHETWQRAPTFKLEISPPLTRRFESHRVVSPPSTASPDFAAIAALSGHS